MSIANVTKSRIDHGIGHVVDTSLKKMTYIEDLANKSNKFHSYCWSDYKELDGCFRASSIMFVGYDQSNNILAYLNKIEAQAEDSGIVYRLKIQNLTTNEILLDQKFYYDEDSKKYENKKINNIELFYKYKKIDIVRILQKFNVQYSIFSFKYLPYNKNYQSIFLGFSTTQSLATFGYNEPQKVLSLNKLIIKKNNKLIYKQNYSKGQFCSECIYPFFLLEPLTIIELGSTGKKLLVIDLLAYDFHSPNTLFFQLIEI